MYFALRKNIFAILQRTTKPSLDITRKAAKEEIFYKYRIKLNKNFVLRAVQKYFRSLPKLEKKEKIQESHFD